MVETIRRGLQNDDLHVSMTQLCRWCEGPRRSAYYKPLKTQPKMRERFVEPIKVMIEENPWFGYRTVAHLLKFNKNTVQRIFQLEGWQVKTSPVRFRPRVQAWLSVGRAQDERWPTDMCQIWAGPDCWATLALIVDCHTRELLGCF
jgi:putative transposase